MPYPIDRRRAHTYALQLLSELTDTQRRASAASALAQHVGANAIIIFLLDRDVGTYLPAPGFTQTLPRGREWQTFLRKCAAEGEALAELDCPGYDGRQPVIGVHAHGGAIMALVGGAPHREDIVDLQLLLPLLATAFEGERAALASEAQAELARRSVAEARQLADGLESARRELNRLYGEVREALRVRDEVLAAVTHDLNTPLTAMLGFAQLLHRFVARNNPPGAERILHGLTQIESMASRMRRQLDQLLDVAQLQMGRSLRLNYRTTDLVELVRRACAEHQEVADNHQIIIDAEAASVKGRWDTMRIERVLDNLLSNAVKYSPEGGAITVTVRAETSGEEAWAILTVSDQGIGIPVDDLPRVFERFYRAGNISEQMRGTGIGLASVRQIVEEHGGSITVESAPHKGSTFCVRLPLRSAEAGVTA